MIGVKLSRRAFLLVLASLSRLAGHLGAPLRASDGSAPEKDGRQVSAEGPGHESGTAAGDLDTLVALGFVLVPSSFAEPGGAEPGAGLTAVVESLFRKRLRHLEQSTSGARAEFRSAAALLDQESARVHGSRFAALDLPARRRLAQDILGPFANRTALTAPYYYLTPRGSRVRRLWDSAAHPLVMAFYDSELAWRVMNYPVEPGTCSDLVGYQSPPT